MGTDGSLRSGECTALVGGLASEGRPRDGRLARCVYAEAVRLVGRRFHVTLNVVVRSGAGGAI